METKNTLGKSINALEASKAKQKRKHKRFEKLENYKDKRSETQAPKNNKQVE
jgi:hypothetical protein